jgi:hypothetical protein
MAVEIIAMMLIRFVRPAGENEATEVRDEPR